MKSVFLSFFCFCFALGSLNSYAALNPSEERLVNMMTSGNLRELKGAAKEIHSRRLTNPEVLDVAAEILLQLYPNAWDGQIDTLSWLARALGHSGQARYYEVITEVIDGAPHKKLRKHAKKAIKELTKTTSTDGVTQYKKGMKKVVKKDYY